MAALVAHDAQRVAAVRRFNRFYTQHLGVLHDGWLQSPAAVFSLDCVFLTVGSPPLSVFICVAMASRSATFGGLALRRAFLTFRG